MLAVRWVDLGSIVSLALLWLGLAAFVFTLYRWLLRHPGVGSGLEDG